MNNFKLICRLEYLGSSRQGSRLCPGELELADLDYYLRLLQYHPPPRINSLGLSPREMVRRIDFVGGALSTVGLVFILVGLNSGGRSHLWRSAYVLGFLTLGTCFMVVFGLWEWFGTRYPLFPRRIIHAPRPFFCILLVIFTAGINCIPLVVFWPIESIGVYGLGRHQTGVSTLPIEMGILGVAILSALLISIFKRRIMLVMSFFCMLQTVGRLYKHDSLVTY